eukprot:9155978-Alexandrium_andersonii.AAC.1
MLVWRLSVFSSSERTPNAMARAAKPHVGPTARAKNDFHPRVFQGGASSIVTPVVYCLAVGVPEPLA